MDLPTTPLDGANDIFSLSDQVLSDRLQFIEEIGFGNWGSVWLCKPKKNPKSPTADHLDRAQDVKVAVKLVHRSKTPTTAARVRSLWNEMKIVRTFKDDPHPSIIPFHSFIITPSYALITMTFLPTLIPVEVPEAKARDWFRSLLSGIEFLHKRGVVHNDIKPANILLSFEHVPVLVDFGFAEKYEELTSQAFHSNLAYGTPEYLSPERARGILHDTRKSDVWSLGVTFFEILVGRTPFEAVEGESFSTKADLENYWQRTMRGKWVGSWKMTRGAEKMLRRMIAPNADMRCTASEAMSDAYWNVVTHKRNISGTPSLSLEIDASKLLDILPPWSGSKDKDKQLPPVPSAKGAENRPLKKAQSKPQPRNLFSKVKAGHKREKSENSPEISILAGLSPPIPKRGKDKENVISLNSAGSKKTDGRRPLGARDVLSPFGGPNLHSSPASKTKVVKKMKSKARVALGDVTADSNVTATDVSKSVDKSTASSKNSSLARERVKDWEREKERMREMARLEEMEREQDDGMSVTEPRKSEEVVEMMRENLEEELPPPEVDRSKDVSQNIKTSIMSMRTPSGTLSSAPLFLDEHPSKSAVVSPPSKSSVDVFRHNVRRSIDLGVRLYKSSAAHIAGRSTPKLSLGLDEAASRVSESRRQSWEDDALVQDANSSLPTCRHAVLNERIGAENRADRMTIWMQNVEKVVEDARETFAASSNKSPLPPLPLAPVSRSASVNRRNSRLPRKLLAANQIFCDNGEIPQTYEGNQSTVTLYLTPDNSILPLIDTSFPVMPSTSRLSTIPPSPEVSQTPTRPRRATVTSRSPEASVAQEDVSFTFDTGSPSQRREKSKSQGNLSRMITPPSRIELDLQLQVTPVSNPRLSALIDRSHFVAPPISIQITDSPTRKTPTTRNRSVNFDELTSSPLHVEPYPQRIPSRSPSTPLDSPTQRRVEGVYDRFLMATSGVKRAGKGYCSDNTAPLYSTPQPTQRRSMKNFHSTRKAMPPPVSSEQLKIRSVDELGMCKTPGRAGESSRSVGLVRRALKAMTGKTHTRRLSQTVFA